MAAKSSVKNKSSEPLTKAFVAQFAPLEGVKVLLLTDKRTGAQFCECHIKASKLIELGTTDVPLDPDEQEEYRANREIVENAPAYRRMIDDAKKGRSFSNIVAEFTTEFEKETPLKVIGGQHRFSAIESALKQGVDEYHGVKVYFDLDMDQRLDVQLISNTNIAISRDLFDRMHETSMGPELRAWCQDVGLLGKDEDFADRRARGGPISVQLARTFVMNYFAGQKIDAKKFETIETTPDLSLTGQHDGAWESLRTSTPNMWKHAGLRKAGSEFATLIIAQRKAFSGGKKRPRPDYPEKAMNPAVLASWSFVAGVFDKNEVRLKRHFELANTTGRDPLNAAALASGRHKTDPANYRGLGYRTDAKERGRLAELFYLQTDKGDGITKANIEVAIAKYHAKQALLEVGKLQAKAAADG